MTTTNDNVNPGRSIQDSGAGSRSIGTASICRASMPTAESASKTRQATSAKNAKTVSNGVALKRQKAVHKGLEKKQKAGTGTGRSKRSKKKKT